MSQSLTNDQQQTLSTFIAMTNAEVPVAKAFLKATSWDINTAMDRFFAFGGDASKLAPPKNNNRVLPQQSQQPNQPQQPSLMSATANLMQQALGGFFSNGGAIPQSQPQPQAQAQSQSLPSSNINNNNNNSQQIHQPLQQQDQDALLAQQLATQQHRIRAPDQTYQERMVGPYTNQYGSSIYKQRKDAEQNFAKDWQRGPKNEKSSFLGALFSDPNYKFMGSLEDAKKTGTRENKWLLINIQDTENFCSHCLNRDIWKDKELGPVIKESFIFYQWMRRTDNAKRVINLYHPYKFPCVFIIDPNTGRQEHQFNIPDSPDKINTLKPKLLEFLDNYPNPKAKPKGNKKQTNIHNNNNNNNNNTIINNNNNNNSNNNDDKLLQQAIQESLQQQQLIKEDEMKKQNNSQQQQQQQQEQQEQQQQQQLDPQPNSKDPNATAIRIRMPNGSILQRLFKKNAKVNQLYIWCTLSLNGQKISLIQTMPRLKLDDKRNKTLQELGLIRATLVCCYVD